MEGPPITSYNAPDGGVGTFYRVCPDCGRFLKMPETITWLEMEPSGDDYSMDVKCSRCGPVRPMFVGWFSDDELTT